MVSGSLSSSLSESSQESATFFFVALGLLPVEVADVNDVLPVSVVAVEVATLSVSVESTANRSSSALLVSSPSPMTSRRLKSDSGSLRKFARLAVTVARTSEKSVGYI